MSKPRPYSLTHDRDLNYFSSEYHEARSRFLDQAQRIQTQDPQAELQSFHVPSQRDNDLYVDWLYLPAKEKTETLFILVSGVHGMEAFTGCAIQRMFLEELLPELPRERVGLLIVHSLNPFGFKYGRRSTENNVNLNRNFATSDTLFQSPNPGYAKIARAFETEGPVKNLWSSLLKTGLLVAKCLTKEGFTGADLNQAIAQGQFKHPRGIEYGGQKREPQIEHFLQKIKSVIGDYRNIATFDLHTGLGDRYELHLLPTEDPATVQADLLKTLFDFESDRALYQYTPTDSEGFYSTYGDLNRIFPAIARPDQKVLALTFEFGTLGNGLLSKLQTLDRILLENQAFHFGCADSETARQVRERYRELFFPSEPLWRKNAIARSREAFKRILKRVRSLN